MVILVPMERGRGDGHFGGWFVAYGGRTAKSHEGEETGPAVDGESSRKMRAL